MFDKLSSVEQRFEEVGEELMKPETVMDTLIEDTAKLVVTLDH